LRRLRLLLHSQYLRLRRRPPSRRRGQKLPGAGVDGEPLRLPPHGAFSSPGGFLPPRTPIRRRLPVLQQPLAPRGPAAHLGGGPRRHRRDPLARSGGQGRPGGAVVTMFSPRRGMGGKRGEDGGGSSHPHPVSWEGDGAAGHRTLVLPIPASPFPGKGKCFVTSYEGVKTYRCFFFGGCRAMIRSLILS